MGKVKKLKAKVKRWKARYLGLNELCEAYQGEIKRLDRELHRVKTDYEMVKDERDSLFERLYGEPFRHAVEKLADMPRITLLTERETNAVKGETEAEMLESIAHDYDAQINDLKLTIEMNDDKAAQIQVDLDEANKKIEILENKLECRTTALEALRDEKNEADSYSTETIADLRDKIIQLEYEVRDKSDYISVLEDRVEELEEDVENFKYVKEVAELNEKAAVETASEFERENLRLKGEIEKCRR